MANKNNYLGPANPVNEQIIPATVYVDLDGTLIKSDLLLESLFRLLEKNFFFLFMIPLWLLGGKANLKHQLAARVDVKTELLPYNSTLLTLLLEMKQQGSELVLISASNQRYVDRIAEHLQIFDAGFGSDESTNLKGEKKLERIRDHSGDKPYIYAGNERADLAIWNHAKGAIVVNGDANLLNEIVKRSDVIESIDTGSNLYADTVRAVRVHQWAKNLLIFLPLLLSHQMDNLGLIMLSLSAFASFSFCASSVYLLNDLVDLEHDRKHSTKKERPFASGQLSLHIGLFGAPLLLVAAILTASVLPWEFMAVMLTYYVLTLCYSFYLKAIAIVDVLTLACLYTLRIIAGAAAISVLPTFWLLAFSMFLFMSLAIVKRVAELSNLRNNDQTQASGRGYRSEDLVQLSILGSASGFMAVLVFALYINAEETQLLYDTPQLLWFICPLLLYLVSRIWLLTNRGMLSEDPVVFFISDRNSQLVTFLSAFLVWAATGDWI